MKGYGRKNNRVKVIVNGDDFEFDVSDEALADGAMFSVANNNDSSNRMTGELSRLGYQNTIHGDQIDFVGPGEEDDDIAYTKRKRRR